MKNYVFIMFYVVDKVKTLMYTSQLEASQRYVSVDDLSQYFIVKHRKVGIKDG